MKGHVGCCDILDPETRCSDSENPFSRALQFVNVQTHIKNRASRLLFAQPAPPVSMALILKSAHNLAWPAKRGRKTRVLVGSRRPWRKRVFLVKAAARRPVRIALCVAAPWQALDLLCNGCPVRPISGPPYRRVSFGGMQKPGKWDFWVAVKEFNLNYRFMGKK